MFWYRLTRNTFYEVAISHDPNKVFLHERIAPQAKWEPTKNDNSVRKLALSGEVVGSWRNRSSDKVLFSAFDNECRLGFAADPQKCELQKLGSHENVAGDNMDVVERLHAEAIDEIERRGLDPVLVKWLRSYGKDEFPSDFRSTDAHPAPNGWYGGYWNKMFKSFGIK